MRPRLLAIVALACAAFLYVGPSSAFDLTTMGRSVGASVVATSSAYNALTIVTCNGFALTATTCSTNLVTNQGTTDQTYRIAEDTDANNKVSTYGIDGGATKSSGYTAWTGSKSIGSSAAFNLNLVACGALTGCATTKTYNTLWTVEGQKSATVDFTATKVLIVIQYP